MKYSFTSNFIILFFLTLFSWAENRSPFLVTQELIKKTFNRTNGCFILITRSTGNMICFNPQGCMEKLPPCSTFKIWNTLIGLETGLIISAEDTFYKWDGETRLIPEWNKNLTLRQAFEVSCVPAFQELARKIGEERMKLWIEKINYGDCDISSGVDIFWLPRTGKKSLLITPLQQTELILNLVSKRLPFSPESLEILKDIMVVREDDEGTLYGKTGTGADEKGKNNLGWFVGYFKRNREIYTFSCVVKGENLMGKNARVLVEKIFEKAAASSSDL